MLFVFRQHIRLEREQSQSSYRAEGSCRVWRRHCRLAGCKMSSGGRRIPDAPIQPQGLSIAQFLATLEWLAESHPALPNASFSEGCAVCKTCNISYASLPVDHISAVVSFHVSADHVIAFSSCFPSKGGYWKIPAAVAIEDGNFRLALKTSETGSFQCMTVNPALMLSEPTLSQNNAKFSMHINFPFVTMALESTSTNSATDEKEKSLYTTLFADLKDGLIELHAQSSDGQPMENRSAETRNQSSKQFISSLQATATALQDTDRVKASDWKTAAYRFVATGSPMLTPPFLSLFQVNKSMGVDGNEEHDHVGVVNAFLVNEVVRDGAVCQQEACMAFATHKRRCNDKMLSKEEIRKRRREIEALNACG